jgi:hypothetical protein
VAVFVDFIPLQKLKSSLMFAALGWHGAIPGKE